MDAATLIIDGTKKTHPLALLIKKVIEKQNLLISLHDYVSEYCGNQKKTMEYDLPPNCMSLHS